MRSKISEAIQEALSRGYQVDPEAFRLLQGIPERIDVAELVDKAVEMKQSRNDLQNIILKQDLEAVVPKTPEEIEAEALTQSPEKLSIIQIEEEVEIMKDPTPLLNPIEGVEGFSRLFKNRFEKLVRIASERPDAHHMRRIEELRALPSQGSHKIAGLLMARKMRRGQVELQLEDPTGKLRDRKSVV